MRLNQQPDRAGERGRGGSGRDSPLPQGGHQELRILSPRPGWWNDNVCAKRDARAGGGRSRLRVGYNLTAEGPLPA